ncbi:MAG: glycolate oxidase subunit GlcD, partial [Thermodesulfobacteriota bacterium]|nr:glycolate oxidase subunit GlcD [Thermodesulfobacteriota bacterium]
MLDKAAIKNIQNIVGEENVAQDKETMICYSYDAANIKYLPDLIAYPRTPEQISAILKLANEAGFPVI